MMQDEITVTALVVVGATASFFDIRERRVPNWLVFAAIIAGLLYHNVVDGWQGLGLAVEGMAVGAAILLGPYVFGAVGAGDVKLLMAFGALAGPENVLRGSLAGIVLAGFGTALILTLRGRLFQMLRGIGAWALLTVNGVRAPLAADRSYTLPYAVFLALGMAVDVAWRGMLD